VPELGVNLLSFYVLNEKGLNAVFNPKDYLIRKEKNDNSAWVISEEDASLLS
jgi:hypothetical protein